MNPPPRKGQLRRDDIGTRRFYVVVSDPTKGRTPMVTIWHLDERAECRYAVDWIIDDSTDTLVSEPKP